MKIMAHTLVLVLLASQTFGAIDPQENSTGFYFDQDANEFCRDGVDFEEQVSVYFVVTNLTEALYGIEAGLEFEGAAFLMTQQTLLSGIEPLTVIGNLMLILFEPHPVQEAIPMFRLTFLYLDNNGGAVNLYLRGSTPSSLDPDFPTLFFADHEMERANMRVQGQPSAQINGDCTTDVSGSMSLSALKALYR